MCSQNLVIITVMSGSVVYIASAESRAVSGSGEVGSVVAPSFTRPLFRRVLPRFGCGSAD